MERRRRGVAIMADFSAILPCPDYLHTSKDGPNARQNTSPHGFIFIIPQSPSKSPLNGHLGQRYHNNGRKRGDLCLSKRPWPWPTLSTFVSSLLNGRGASKYNSVSCRHGAFIVSCSCAGNNRRDTIGSYQWQWHFDGCKYCF